MKPLTDNNVLLGQGYRTPSGTDGMMISRGNPTIPKENLLRDNKTQKNGEESSSRT
jgi:hypothetical protein